MTDDSRSLDSQASKFAADLSATVCALISGCEPFVHQALSGSTDRFVVRQDPPTGIPLTVDGDRLLTLTVNYKCVWDSKSRFLVIEESSFKIYSGAEARREPLIRYEYVREQNSEHPSAHIHVHAHRDAITYAMSRSGPSSKTGKKRMHQSVGDFPTLGELHLPVGGPRFRPCLEDVLETLVLEFGVEHNPEGRHALKSGRAGWRRTQVQTVVRDAPEDAAEQLRRLGYMVAAPNSGVPSVNVERLQEL